MLSLFVCSWPKIKIKDLKSLCLVMLSARSQQSKKILAKPSWIQMRNQRNWEIYKNKANAKQQRNEIGSTLLWTVLISVNYGSILKIRIFQKSTKNTKITKVCYKYKNLKVCLKYKSELNAKQKWMEKSDEISTQCESQLFQ